MKRLIRILLAATLAPAGLLAPAPAATAAAFELRAPPGDCCGAACRCRPEASCGCEVRRAPARSQPQSALPPATPAQPLPTGGGMLQPDVLFAVLNLRGHATAAWTRATAAHDPPFRLLVVLQV
jgi:hypothetical protein